MTDGSETLIRGLNFVQRFLKIVSLKKMEPDGLQICPPASKNRYYRSVNYIR